MTDISDLTDMSTLGPFDVLYSWEDPATSVGMIFAASRMEEAVKRIGHHVQIIGFDQKHVDFVKDNRGIEQHRLKSLRKLKHLPPILMLKWPDGSHLTIDGNHRYVVAAERGKYELSAYIVDMDFARQFIVAIGRNLPMPTVSGIGMIGSKLR